MSACDDITAPTLFLSGKVALHAGDCFAVLDALPENSVDSVVTDPPYHLTSIVRRFGAEGAAAAKDYTGEKDGATGAYARASRGFMGKQWDGGDIAFQAALWRKVLRVLKPGGHVVAFSGTRTYHRMACAIEDAGFEIRDQLAWAYGSGFPKSHDVSKAIDKAAGFWRGRAGAVKIAEQVAKGTEYERAEKGEPVTADARAWEGWGTALKPAWEPICLARKPLVGTVAENVLAHGVGALNVDGCRVGDDVRVAAFTSLAPCAGDRFGDADTSAARRGTQGEPKTYVGRWPANIVHDGSDEVTTAFGDTAPSRIGKPRGADAGDGWGMTRAGAEYDDSGSAARFFYTAKADADDRLGSKHPTVKPVDLMRWLVRLVTPKGGTVLDPFAGTGTTGHAAFLEGFSAILIEREAEYRADIARRMALALAGPIARKAAIAKPAEAESIGGLFGGPDPLRGGAGVSTATSPIRMHDSRAASHETATFE